MPDRQRHLESHLVIAAGFLVLFLIWGWMGFVYVALGICVVAAFVPGLAKYIHLGWNGLGHVLGLINSTLILGILFYLVLTPLALLRRVVAKDPLMRKRAGRSSFFVDRKLRYEKKHLENPW